MMSDFSMLRLEHNGDNAREILGAGSEQLKKLKYYLKNYPVEALLMSAGGNDLVAEELKRVLNARAAGATWQSAVKLDKLTTVLDDIVAAYERLLDARDSLRPNCVVFAHSYCYFEPTGRKATGPFGLGSAGPWMRPVLKAKGIDPATEGPQRGALPGRRAACAAAGAGGAPHALHRGRHARRVAGGRRALGRRNPSERHGFPPAGAGFLAADPGAPVSRSGVQLMRERAIAAGGRAAARDAAREG